MGELLNDLNEASHWIVRPLQIRTVYVNVLVRVVALKSRAMRMGSVQSRYLYVVVEGRG